MQSEHKTEFSNREFCFLLTNSFAGTSQPALARYLKSKALENNLKFEIYYYANYQTVLPKVNIIIYIIYYYYYYYYLK